MVNVVGVRFRNAGKIYYFDPCDMQLREGDKVIVETVRGIECGEVVTEPRPVPEEEITQPLRRVVRKASPQDEATVEANREKERKAFKIGLDKIAAHGLPMKLVDVEYTFDGSKIIFFFTADGRVDFRELVKDLAGVFRTRIELRQIGVRDEAKMLGGLGPCGRSLCCTTFLKDFEPVSIRMAKDQNLSLNPTKISGICGRLMCCLKYEHEVYRDLRQGLLPMGSEIQTPLGLGKVVELDVLKGIAAVKLADGKTVYVSARDPGIRRACEERQDVTGSCPQALLHEAATGARPNEVASAGPRDEQASGGAGLTGDAGGDYSDGRLCAGVEARLGEPPTGQMAVPEGQQQGQTRSPRRRRRRQRKPKLTPTAIASRQLAPVRKPDARATPSGADRRTGTGGTAR